ncbi:MAG: hypothetical protein KGL13_08405 [Gammaproteobacteria bacterium]|nr:hypothetical protein [Gammaproteobacteria bacterium]
MAYRPTSITVIGWFETVIGLLGALTLTIRPGEESMTGMLQSMLRFHPPTAAVYVGNLLGVCVTLACGIGLLKRQNWARYLYLGWSLLSDVYFVMVFQTYVLFFFIPSFLLTLVIIFFLFTPTARKYFTAHE